MNKDEMNRAIAEACGWKIEPYDKYEWVVINPDGYQIAWSSQSGVVNRYPASYYLPPYATCLNAVESAIANLPSSKKEWLWMVELPKIVGCPVTSQGDSFWRIQCPELLLSATAAQRAEAFLRTLNLYQDTRES